jgi:hypothetical protein
VSARSALRPSRAVGLCGGQEAVHGRIDKKAGHRRMRDCADWNTGILKYWNIGVLGRVCAAPPIIPSFPCTPPPEASACGRFFDLSAHGRHRVWCRAEGGSRGGVLGGHGTALPPEPPLLLGLGRAWDRPSSQAVRGAGIACPAS